MAMHDASRHGLRATAAVGLVAFGGFFLLAWLSPSTLETHAHAYVVDRVTEEVDQRFADLDSLTTQGRLGALAERYADRADTVRAFLAGGVAGQTARALAELCHYDCGTPESLEPDVERAGGLLAASLDRAAERALDFARGRYSESVVALVQDLRIFAGINAGLFLFVLVGSYFAPRAPASAAVALWLLTAATLLSIVMYLFGRDWVYAFLMDSYWGFGYGAWVGLVLLLMCDWILGARFIGWATDLLGAAISGA